MPPPPAEPFASRIFLGPALRTQPDRRLVKLVREGYEAAFEEIVRRYRKPLDRFAAAFVGSRSEDVTQDAFSKALLALRGSEKEIELRPWLYRIVRNTALNDLRDQPGATAELGESLAGGPSAAVEAERREEIRDLMDRLRALPEPQRAAIVMRELEGLSHEEIAAALGVSGGAARQAIHRARVALRDGFGLLVPLPLLRLLFDHGAEAAAGAGAGGAAAAGAASAAGGGGAALGGLGAAGALKVGVATALLAGSVGAGVAMQQDRGQESPRQPAAVEASVLRGGGDDPTTSDLSGDSGERATGVGSGDEPGHGGGRDGDDRRRSGGDHRGRGEGRAGEDLDDSGHGGPGPGGSSGHGSGGGGGSGSDDSGGGHSGGGTSGGSHSGRGGSSSGTGGGSGSSGGSGRDGSSGGGDGGGGGGGRSGGGDGGPDRSGSGSSGSSGSGGSDGGSSGGRDSGGGDPAPTVAPPPPPPPPPSGSGGESGSGGSGSGDDGSSSGGEGSGGGESDS